jgi:hypothetical protein
MKLILAAALLLTACIDGPGASPDAPPWLPLDASVDAPPAPHEGCNNMGLLPDDVTLTLGPTDPIPGSLITEIQEMFPNGGKRSDFARGWTPPCWSFTGVAPTVVNNPSGPGPDIPVWKIPANQDVWARIPYEVGDRIVGANTIPFEIYGDGTITILDMRITFFPSISTGVGAVSVAAYATGLTPVPVGWNTPFMSAGAIDDVLLTQGGVLQLEFELSAAGSEIYLGMLYLPFDRP